MNVRSRKVRDAIKKSRRAVRAVQKTYYRELRFASSDAELLAVSRRRDDALLHITHDLNSELSRIIRGSD